MKRIERKRNVDGEQRMWIRVRMNEVLELVGLLRFLERLHLVVHPAAQRWLLSLPYIGEVWC